MKHLETSAGIDLEVEEIIIHNEFKKLSSIVEFFLSYNLLSRELYVGRDVSFDCPLKIEFYNEIIDSLQEEE